MLKVDTSKVSIKEIKSGFCGVFSTKKIKKGEYVLVEDITAFYNTSSDLVNFGEPILLTVWLLQNPDLYKKVLKSGVKKGLWKLKTPKDDAKLLKKIQRDLGLSKEKVNEVYNIVCAYNTRNFYFNGILATPRIQLSHFTNMINHSCEANLIPVITYTDLNEFRQRVMAFTAKNDIDIGEEITYSYFGDELITKSSTERKLILKRKYGFNCGCKICKINN